jgi:predicted Rossmann fold nucleotide-binding protein DprA/Smf involved in DNA uptake
MMMKLIIAGGREFNDYQLMKESFDKYINSNNVTIISGTARGADRLGEVLAQEYGLELIRMPANWNEYGKRAGYIRNESMANVATHALIFWDGQSNGTRHMINLAKQYDLTVYVVPY